MPPVPRRRPREDNPWGPGRSVRPWGPSPVSIPVPQRIIIDLIDTFNAKLDSLDVASNALLDQTTEWSVEARKQDRKEGSPEKDSFPTAPRKNRLCKRSCCERNEPNVTLLRTTDE